MPTEVRKYVPLHFKKPLLVTGIVLTRASLLFILSAFPVFEPEIIVKYLSLNLAVNRTERRKQVVSLPAQAKLNRIEQRNGMFHALSFPQTFPRSKNFPILSNNDERQKCSVTCCALLVILLAEKSMSSATYRELI